MYKKDDFINVSYKEKPRYFNSTVSRIIKESFINNYSDVFDDRFQKVAIDYNYNYKNTERIELKSAGKLNLNYNLLIDGKDETFLRIFYPYQIQDFLEFSEKVKNNDLIHEWLLEN